MVSIIDGGGVRGVFVVRILSALEKTFQRLHGKQTRIADHVDVIAGTSTGGLIAAMLASPDKNGRPMFQAKGIEEFYSQNCAKIFPQSNSRFIRLLRYIRAIFKGPIYSGKNLRQMINNTIPNLRLNETITNLVIPTFDMKDNKAIIFSTYKARKDTLMNPHLKDICIGTAAAPIYLPPHGFTINDTESGKSAEFNLIDGGLVANNPTFLAMTEAIDEYRMQNPEDTNLESLRFVVLSSGTGEVSNEPYDAKTAEKWGMLRWIKPLIDALFKGNEEAQKKLKNLIWDKVTDSLRIQPRNLSRDLASLDDSSMKNLEGLVSVADRHLQQVVNKDDIKGLDLNDVQSNDGITYQMALEKFAKISYEESKKRIASKSNEGNGYCE
ncbi:patatin-like protein 5 [Cryptomeria japonica]|uniref:patatin-like protein 5 n=1 Tax=Cryptomeria japonica TaxID=3369 RepID=UPI0027DAA610|nr:patatin-like protein 5 [Cryptomeria japonica]